ncbi:MULTISPECIES: DUF1877 family protein [unclassified Streptomyces]|uniref:DUF1877 family protein n=1 Tax=unclassified Streptomyces TaxID=2593676 RepID=UPI00224F8AB2|nr:MULTISPECIES: DUF1877 family protein [unclassified Streptomyces]WSP59407.1 YfbM family protein [Streptomyces sp. NBC_01241]WSU20073.1 YfbM family protein [Streptomyces sp. NBC_01108]MCX4791170.1 YfbM family protein [Streptomyces sp. NBC_01221]MCX4793112.1 YfbM family protein [Streptomyces sp. NBC_01242]WSP61002.1 YfbM family protein [Streptomyces sp. NBC_01240]
MSFHMHLRSVQNSEVRLDYAWIEEFMGAAWDWDARQAEYKAGIAESIEKDFSSVHELYEAGSDLSGGRGGAWELPIFGGDIVYHPADEQPPFLHLPPDTVRRASAFLADVSFDVLWEAAGPELHTAFGPGWAEEDVRDIYDQHHAGLLAFYQRAAMAGRAVVKGFWY